MTPTYRPSSFAVSGTGERNHRWIGGSLRHPGNNKAHRGRAEEMTGRMADDGSSAAGVEVSLMPVRSSKTL